MNGLANLINTLCDVLERPGGHYMILGFGVIAGLTMMALKVPGGDHVALTAAGTLLLSMKAGGKE